MLCLRYAYTVAIGALFCAFIVVCAAEETGSKTKQNIEKKIKRKTRGKEKNRLRIDLEKIISPLAMTG